jgi:hypothetical protein
MQFIAPGSIVDASLAFEVPSGEKIASPPSQFQEPDTWSRRWRCGSGGQKMWFALAAITLAAATG